jgi:hypothetical protein
MQKIFLFGTIAIGLGVFGTVPRSSAAPINPSAIDEATAATLAFSEATYCDPVRVTFPRRCVWRGSGGVRYRYCRSVGWCHIR